MFCAWDWAIVLLYMAAILVVGLVMSRGQHTHRDYFLGNRDLPWWMVGLSIVATETSALTFIGVPAMAIGTLGRAADGSYVTTGGNLYFLQIAIGYVTARIIVAIVMVPHYYRGDVYTPYQLLNRAFGSGPRTLAAAMATVNMFLQAGFRVYVTAIPVMIVMRTVFPGWGIWRSIVLFTAVSVVYTVIGGVKAVVWTEMIQFFILFLGGLFAMLYIPTLLTTPDGHTGWAALAQVAADKLAVFNGGLVDRGPDQGLWSWLGACLAEVLGGDFNIWMGLIGATVGVMVSHGVDQLNVQRVLVCRDERGGRRALFLSAAIIAPQFLIFLLVGAGLFAFYTLNGFDFGGLQPWDPTLARPVPKADFIFPIFIVVQVPPLIKGFMIAGILAAAMSSLASALTAISSVTIMDLLGPWRASRRSELLWGRLGTLVTAAVLVGIAWWAKDAPLIFNMVFQFAGIFAGAKLGSVLFAIWKRSGYPGPVMTGMVVSLAIMATVVWLTKSGRLPINWPWYPLIGTAICLAVVRLLSGSGPGPASRDIDSEP